MYKVFTTSESLFRRSINRVGRCDRGVVTYYCS